MDWNAVGATGTVAGVVFGVVGGAYGFTSRLRTEELRRSEVLQWVVIGIDALHRLVFDIESGRKDRLDATAEELSALVEGSRLFFKNKPLAGHGDKKPSAYKGLRPCILDELVAGFLVAGRGKVVSEAERPALLALAIKVERKFVSFAQEEVGRSRAASANASTGGHGVRLRTLLDELTAEDLAEATRRFVR